MDTSVSCRKGFIHYVDNPVLVQAVTDNLLSHGVRQEHITIGRDSWKFIESLSEGDVVVVDSLYDIVSSQTGLVETICSIIDRRAGLISLRDNLEIGKGDGKVLSLLNTISKYLKIFGSYKPVGNDCRVPPTSRPKRGRPEGNVSNEHRNKYENALNLYNKGLSMQEATRQSGCNYSSFWYWYRKNQTSVDCSGQQ